MRISVFLLLFPVLFPAALSAQQRVHVTGKTFAVSTTGEGQETLPYTNILVLEAKDSTLVKGVTSGADGIFHISFTARERTPYLLKVSYIGMTPEFRTLDTRKSRIHVGDILLSEGVELPEVVVAAPIKEVEQAGDTTVINATAYKLPEGAYLEELVRRIPGLDYDRQSGSLTYNGQTITEINVNGETFFSGDRKMALENLPAELVNKIKVYNKKSELEKITDVDSGADNYVLDLQTPRKFDGTLIASGKTGYGNHRKKELEVTGNLFRQGGENLSLIARSGNRQLTTDYRGNLQSSVAANAVKKFGKKLSVNGSMVYSRNKNGGETTSYSEQYLSSGNRYTGSESSNLSNNRMVSTMLGVRWQVNKRMLLNLNGNFNHGDGGSSNTGRRMAFNADPGIDVVAPFADMENISDSMKLNGNNMRNASSNRSWQYSINTDLTRRINQRGNSISLTFRMGGSTGRNEVLTRSTTTYFQLVNSLGGDSVLYRNQYSLSPTKNSLQSIGLMFTHPFTKKFRVQLSYNLNYQIQRSDRSTYDLSAFTDGVDDTLPDGYESGYTDSLSNRSFSRTLGHEAVLRLTYSDKIWSVVMGMSIQPQTRSMHQKTGSLQADTTMNSVDLWPSATVTWRKDKGMVRFSYQGGTRQPALSSLLSLTDNSDPLNITQGNPNLKPAYSQTIRLNAQNIRYGIFANAGWQNEFNSQTTVTLYDPITGGRTTIPVNINGSWNADADIRYQKRIRSFSLSVRGGTRLSRHVGLLNEGGSGLPQESTTRNTAFNSELRLSYFPKWGAFDFWGKWRYLHSQNSLRGSDTHTREYDFGLNAYTDLPMGIRLDTDIVYTFRNGTGIIPGEDDQLVWNASLSWRFLQKKQAEISASWADILSRRKNYSRNISSSGLFENHTQQMGTYFMISFRYKYNISTIK